MKTRSLILKLARLFPKSLAKRHEDYVGVMVGPLPMITNKILLCLDLDEEVMEVVRKTKPDLIVTHHPFFYGSKLKILRLDEKKRSIHDELTKMKIGVYSLHTNFDEANNGMNDALSTALELQDVYAPLLEPMMRIGRLNKIMKAQDFVKFAIGKFNLDYGLLIGNKEKIISRVAIIGGGAGRINYIEIARHEKADIYISGDAPHYVRRHVVNENYTYLDLPHEMEKIFMSKMKEIINEIANDIEIIVVDHEETPFLIKAD